MNTSQLIAKFKEGAKLTDTELTKLHDDLKDIEWTLLGKGDMFLPARIMASTMLDRVLDVIRARGLQLKGE